MIVTSVMSDREKMSGLGVVRMSANVLSAPQNNIQRIHAREAMLRNGCYPAKIQRFLSTLDILSCARVVNDVAVRDDAVVQSQLSVEVEQCGPKGQCNLVSQCNFFFPDDKGATLKPFASRLSCSHGYGVYKIGNVTGYCTGEVPTFPGMSVALANFDCVRPVLEIKKAGCVRSFKVCPAGVFDLIFEKSLEVNFQPINFQFDAVGLVHCGAFKFGVCVVEGRVDIMNEALCVHEPIALVGDRFMFAQDLVTKRWIVNDIDGPDKCYRLGVLAGKYGLRVQGYRVAYQFESVGITLSYANLRLFEMITDPAKDVSCGKDLILQKVLQRVSGNMFGFDLCDHFVTTEDLAEVDFMSLLVNATPEDNMYLREQYVEMLSLVEAERLKRVESTSLVKFKDALLPVVTRCRTLLSEAVLVVQDEEREDRGDIALEFFGVVRVSEYLCADYHVPVSLVIDSNARELVSQVPPSGLLANVSKFGSLSKIGMSFEEDQLFVNMTRFGFTDASLLAFLDFVAGSDKRLVLVISAPKQWLIGKLPLIISFLVKVKMRIKNAFIGTSWSSYYCVVQSDGGCLGPNLCG